LIKEMMPLIKQDRIKGTMISANLAASLEILPKITGPCCESMDSSFCYVTFTNISDLNFSDHSFFIQNFS